MSAKSSLLLSLPLFVLAACRSETSTAGVEVHQDATNENLSSASDDRLAPDATPTSATETEVGLATFAGGCFWCMETPFEKLDGVSAVISGYTGGHKKDPTYDEVCRGTTGHAEAVQIHFDPARISYDDLLQVFWRQIDPTDDGGQFVDRGTQYRSEIYYHSDRQRVAALASKKALGASGRFADPIVTEVTEASTWYPAEEYHQDFYKKKPQRYYSYRRGSGRDRFIETVWGADREYEPKSMAKSTGGTSDANRWAAFEKPSDDTLRSQLSALQYKVTQKEGTERAFQNEYWDNKRAGIYVDIVSGEPLFSSLDKFKSGTGWPSFTRPLLDEHITSRTDYHIGYARTEVRSKYADSHLGHVFEDGPAPTGLRYCINSASLRFIPVEELAEKGYAQFAAAFQNVEK